MRAAILHLALLVLGACATGAARERAAEPPAAATIVVVRHAETAGDDPRDPSLSDAGRARAQALLRSVRHLGIRAVYTSQYRRTRDTGRVIADSLNAPLIEVPITQSDIESYSRALLERIDTEHPAGAVLVVGHSNTAPVMAEVASGRPAEPIAETDYGRLFIVFRTAGGDSLSSARYGAD